MASGLAEKRQGKGNAGIKDRAISPTAGIKPYKINKAYRYFYDDFKGRPLCAKANGAGAATGTAADTNLCFTGKNTWEYFIIGTQTVVAPVIGTGGLDVKLDDGAAGGDGAEFSLGITAQSPAAFTIGTDAFYLKLKFSIADQSGMLTFYTGFRLAEAGQAAVSGYDTYGLIGLNRVNASTTAKIVIADELDADAGAVVDTTNTYVEGDDLTLGVYVDKGGTFTYTINGAAPTTVATLKGTSGDVMVPVIHFVDHGDTPGATLLKEFECGLLEANVR